MHLKPKWSLKYGRGSTSFPLGSTSAELNGVSRFFSLHFLFFFLLNFVFSVCDFKCSKVEYFKPNICLSSSKSTDFKKLLYKVEVQKNNTQLQERKLLSCMLLGVVIPGSDRLCRMTLESLERSYMFSTDNNLYAEATMSRSVVMVIKLTTVHN